MTQDFFKVFNLNSRWLTDGVIVVSGVQDSDSTIPYTRRNSYVDRFFPELFSIVQRKPMTIFVWYSKSFVF